MVMRVSMKNLKKIRKKQGLTQCQLAEKVGVNRITICRWEKGTRLPSIACLMKLIEVLHCRMDNFHSGKK